MASSGTFSFNLSVGEAVLHAYQLIQVKRSQITPEHMLDARNCSNLLFAEWENVQPKLWTVELETFPLVQSSPTYTMTPQTILALDVYISQTVGGEVLDRLVYPISRSDYAAYPNKLQEGRPTVCWFNRQIVPKMSFYLTPDGDGPYTAKVWRVKQIEDANLAGAETANLARRFLPSYVYGLSSRLADIYRPERQQALETTHQRLLAQATIQDQEMADIQISPGLQGYFR